MSENIKMNAEEILDRLKSLADERYRGDMESFGIRGKAYGVPVPLLKRLAKEIGRNHHTASELWSIELRETRLLGGMIEEPSLITESQMEEWAGSFQSWDVCDLVCKYAFRDAPFCRKKAFEWSGREEEFVRRAGFVLMAEIAIGHKNAPDEELLGFFPAIRKASVDSRNFVKKAVNWALRQIGKRSEFLRGKAVELAEELSKSENQAARWIGSDAVRELKSETVARILQRKSISRGVG